MILIYSSPNHLSLGRYSGGVVFKNYFDEGKSKITYIQRKYYFPELEKFDKRKIKKEIIAFPMAENGEIFLCREVYEKRGDT